MGSGSSSRPTKKKNSSVDQSENHSTKTSLPDVIHGSPNTVSTNNNRGNSAGSDGLNHNDSTGIKHNTGEIDSQTQSKSTNTVVNSKDSKHLIDNEKSRTGGFICNNTMDTSQAMNGQGSLPSGQPMKTANKGKLYTETVKSIRNLIKMEERSPLNRQAEIVTWICTTQSKIQKLQLQRKTTKSDEEEDQVGQEDMRKKVKEIQFYREEKEGLLNTISEIAGARLKHENPAIADLSDNNRASKLAERFSELYDNEWTDVVEYLREDRGSEETEEKLEESCSLFMIDVVKETYRICEGKAEEYLGKIIKTFMQTEKKDCPVDGRKRCNDFLKLQTSSGDQTLEIIKKETAKETKQRIEGKYSVNYDKLCKEESFQRYCDLCVGLCWYMCIQDPPVVMVSSIRDKKEYFRAYTKSGNHLGYIVWPALLLHKDGPLLYKGVAQYTDDKPQKDEQSSEEPQKDERSSGEPQKDEPHSDETQDGNSNKTSQRESSQTENTPL